MAGYVLLGLVNNIEQTADVVDDLREAGVQDADITVMSHVPYLPKFLAQRGPRMWYLPFIAVGALGGLAIALFIAYVTPRLYEIHVGGQALTPFPPTAIMIFEFVALGALVMAFLGFLIQNRFPILTRQIYDERITDGYIGIEVHAGGDLVDQVENILKEYSTFDVQRATGADYPDPGIRHLIFWGGLGVVGLGAFLVPLLLSYNVIRIPWVNTMKDTEVVQPLDGPRMAAPDESIPVQGPLLIAGEPATEPLPATENSLIRGKMLYDVNCAMCHGPGGEWPDGQKAQVGKYFPEVPALTDGRIQALTPQHIFGVIINGRNRMPSLAENVTAAETWDIVNYVLSLGETSEAAQ